VQRNSVFRGFSNKGFASCETGTDKIEYACEELEKFRLSLEPLVQELSPRLHGIVSRPTKQGTSRRSEDHFQEWAWLMFTNAEIGDSGKPLEASERTQLTINMSRDCLYVGLCLRRRSDDRRLRENLERETNEKLFDAIVRSLGTKEWILTTREQSFDEEEPRYYEESELRTFLLDPKAFWFNVRLEKEDVVRKRTKIVEQVFEIFRILYNIYALAVGTKVQSQPRPKTKPWKMPLVQDNESSEVETDDELMASIANLLSNLGVGNAPGRTKVAGKRDTYRVKRTALPLDLRPKTNITNGQEREYYIDSGFSDYDFERRIQDYDSLSKILDSVSEALGVKRSSFQIMLTKVITDARYLKEGKFIMVNLLRYSSNKSKYFWLVSIAREIAYAFTGSLNYKHQIIMRKVIVKALSTWERDAGK
jgi:hypothetical protein